MYMGLGASSTTDLSNVSSAIAGTPAANVPTSNLEGSPCDIGWTFDPTSGTCVTLTTLQWVENWIGTGYNALIVAGAVIGILLLGGLMNRR